jgi:hypothetical protein
MAKSMAEEITDKEYTWLLIKWGPNAFIELASLREGGAGGFTELEYRAAKVGQHTLNRQREEAERLSKIFSKELQEEIDNEFLKTLISGSSDEDN